MTKNPVLIINSYAGSLTIAAHQERHPVIGSYEDASYGLEIQRANFPKLDYRSTVEEWPQRQDLRDVLVIAHPPCSAFSRQNITKAARGCDAAKFQQTVRVINYALGNRCAALAVESVPGALEGARDCHNDLAASHGYTAHRVLQNATAFGVPQHRPRFWCVFLPRGRHQGLWLPSLTASRVTLRDIRMDRGTPFAHDETRYERQRRYLARAVDARFARRLLAGELGHGSIVRELQRELARRGRPAPAYQSRSGNVHEEGSRCATARAWCCSEHANSTTTFLCRVLRVVDPDDVAGVVLAYAWWAWPQMGSAPARSFYQEEYMAVMGFPAAYDFSAVRPRLVRTFLSRGVCPPVARWVLRAMQQTVTSGRRGGARGTLCPAGATVDFRAGAPAVVSTVA